MENIQFTEKEVNYLSTKYLWECKISNYENVNTLIQVEKIEWKSGNDFLK